MPMPIKNAESRIAQIMEQFDFQRVHRAMTALDWGWVYPHGRRVPTVTQLQETAQGLLREVANGNTDQISVGGLQARITRCGTKHDDLTLEMVLSQTSEDEF
jgi:hypothetical protein